MGFEMVMSRKLRVKATSGRRKLKVKNLFQMMKSQKNKRAKATIVQVKTNKWKPTLMRTRSKLLLHHQVQRSDCYSAPVLTTEAFLLEVVAVQRKRNTRAQLLKKITLRLTVK